MKSPDSQYLPVMHQLLHGQCLAEQLPPFSPCCAPDPPCVAAGRTALGSPGTSSKGRVLSLCVLLFRRTWCHSGFMHSWLLRAQSPLS